MRITAQEPRLQAHLLQQRRRKIAPVAGCADAVNRHRLSERLLDGEAGVERGIRILKNNLHPFAQRQHRAGIEAGDFLAGKLHATAGGCHEIQNRSAGGGLATAGFAHETERAPARNGEADPVHRLHHAGRSGKEPSSFGKMHFQIAHLEQQIIFIHLRFIDLLQRLNVRGGIRFFAELQFTAHFRFIKIIGNGWQHFECRLQPRAASEQALGVGVLRLVKNGKHTALLNNIAAVHHHHPIGQLGDYAEIVCNENYRYTKVRLQLFK